MNKTFDSAFDDSNFKLHVGRVVGSDNFVVDISGGGYSRSMAIAPSDAPALCLAILEAAGLDALSSQNIREALYHLRTEAARIKGQAKAEADRVKLEQEALALCNVHRISQECEPLDSFDGYALGKTDWLAVARAARELNKEATK